MPDWDKSKYPAGSEVYVFEAIDGEKGPRQRGTLLTTYDLEDPDRPMPKIETEDGEILYGYECWWIPVEEAEDVDKEISENSKN